MAGVAHVCAEAFCGEGGGVEELGFEFFLRAGGVGEVGEEAFLVVRGGDAE